MEGTSAEPDSSVSRAQGQAYRLCGSPRPPDPVPPPGPTVVSLASDRTISR